MPNVQKIADSELEILKVLWKDSPRTSNEIYDALKQNKPWSKSTVLTLISRLAEKGAVSSFKRGVHFYSPALSEREYIKLQANSFLERIFEGSIKDLVAYYCENNDLTQEDLKELKKMIESREE
ncbi:MAG: BlaI/MecI/CopY family transcriptional regulator [Clostridiales bacterium]|nr:BlaI/MecI/CopY family transcriptional regulator [Clostridiales bacterium]